MVSRFKKASISPLGSGYSEEGGVIMSSMAVVLRDIDTRGKGRKRKRCTNASQGGLTFVQTLSVFG